MKNTASSLYRASLGAAAVLAALTAVSSAFAAPDNVVDRTVVKTFDVGAAGSLRISTDSGLISVEPGAGNQVRVIAHERVRAKSDGQATRILRGLDLTMKSTRDGVLASAQYDTGGFAQYGKAHRPVEVDFEVIVPAQFAADLTSTGGDITVSLRPGTDYSIDAASVAGAVKVEGVQILAVSGGAGENSLVGKIGHGGVTLHLRANGNITLENANA
ncbi:MAG TPA: hypothetical protein VGL42_03720 [Opitutaceae bacterium]|jgi:hypothetical protein